MKPWGFTGRAVIESILPSSPLSVLFHWIASAIHPSSSNSVTKCHTSLPQPFCFPTQSFPLWTNRIKRSIHKEHSEIYKQLDKDDLSLPLPAKCSPWPRTSPKATKSTEASQMLTHFEISQTSLANPPTSFYTSF